MLLLACAVVASARPHEDGPPAPIVQVCVDQTGQITSADIHTSSGHRDIDEAALKVARASRFNPGVDSSKKNLKHSCVLIKVKFVIQDGQVVPAG